MLNWKAPGLYNRMCSPAGTRTYFPGSMVTVYLTGSNFQGHESAGQNMVEGNEGGEVRVLIASFDKHLQSRSRTLVG
jgi:hypothetical protein